MKETCQIPWIAPWASGSPGATTQAGGLPAHYMPWGGLLFPFPFLPKGLLVPEGALPFHQNTFLTSTPSPSISSSNLTSRPLALNVCLDQNAPALHLALGPHPRDKRPYVLGPHARGAAKAPHTSWRGNYPNLLSLCPLLLPGVARDTVSSSKTGISLTLPLPLSPSELQAHSPMQFKSRISISVRLICFQTDVKTFC